MAKGVPTEPSNPDLFASWLENLALDDARVITTTCDVRGEDEPRGPVAPPILQDSGERGIKRNFIMGRFGLYSADAPVDDVSRAA